MSEPVRVFVSYASRDRAFAEKLVGDLQAAGAEVWWDVSGIDEGDFLDKINQALQQCQWLVLVLTPNAFASKWVKIEVNAAIHRRQNGFMQAVLPVLAAPVKPGTVPPVWDNLHRYDAVANYQGEIARLIHKLGFSSGALESPRPQPQISSSRPHVAAPDRFPPRLAGLGYRVAFLNGAEAILPPLCDVPAGPFLMGSDPAEDEKALPDEQPQHWVTLGAFQIAECPLTVAEYACFVRATGRPEPTGELTNGYELSWQTQLRERLEHPVVMVNWHDAVAYSQWLSERTDQLWRLPTEAEWEKAARWVGSQGRAVIYPWGDQFDAKCCNTMESNRTLCTTPVGSYPYGVSPYGVQDMAGNVWEWTSSIYMPYPYIASDGRERAESTDERRVARGGSWEEIGRRPRMASRSGDQVSLLFGDAGCRLAMTS